MSEQHETSPESELAPGLSKRLAAHVSRVQLERLLRGDGPREATRLRGALLFMDVVGFTQLTLEMARQGRQGAEQQLGLMNVVFRTVIDAAETLGGDIQFFAGDAALVLFRADAKGDLEGPVRRAVAAALRIRALLGSHEVAGRTVEVRLSVSAGDAHAFEVGGHEGRWLPLIAGPALDALFALDRKAGAADVLVSPATWRLVQRHAQGTPRADGSVAVSTIDVGTLALPAADLPAIPSAIAARLAGYVPQIVRESVSADLHDFVAELRSVSVVFIALRGVDPDQENQLEQLRAAVEIIQAQTQVFGGVVHEMMCDDKGTSVVAVFGLPPLAHDDDATRAVQAATAIRERLAPIVEPRVGVATGSVFCGVYGNRSREHYGIVGSTINRAARLMQAAAASGVLVCTDTERAARRHLDFERLEPVRVKGEAQPVEVFRAKTVQRRGASVGRGGPSMVGRAAEAEELRRRLHALAASKTGGSVLIQAEAGLGKSTLLARMLELAAAESVVVHVGGADPIETSTAYFPFRNVVASVLGIRHTEDLGERRAVAERAFARLDEKTRQLGPLLDALLALDLPDNDLTGQMLGAIRAENLQQLLLGLLKIAADDAPFVIAIEDLHWLDSPSWGLCRRIADELPNVLFVGTMRPMDVRPAELDALSRGEHRTVMALGLLGDDETVEVVRGRLGAEAIPVTLKRLITQRAEGNPFYAEELALALLGGGSIVVEDGACRVVAGQGSLDTLALPATVHGVITSRIDRLGPAVQLTLKVASVVGRSFEADMVRAIRPRDEGEDAIREHLATAARAELLVPEGDRGGYAFKHALTHETTYALMSAAMRNPLHEKAAEFLEQHNADHLTPWYGRLAHHYSEADLPAKALDYLGLAGQQALDAWANNAARDYFARAIAIDEKLRGSATIDLRRATWHQKLAEAHYSLIQFDDARAHYEKAIRMCGFPKPAFGIATPWQVLQHVGGRYGTAPPPATGELRERCIVALRAADNLQVICLWKGDKLSLAHTVFEGTNIARKLGPSPESAFARAMVGYLLMLGGMREVAERDLLAAVEMAEASGALLQRCSTHMYLGMSYSALGRLNDAFVHLVEADEIAGRLGAGLWKHRGKYMRAEATMMSGRMADAAELFEWCAIYAQGAEPPITGFAKAMKALCLLNLGRPAEEALAIIRGPMGIRLVRDNPTPLWLYVCLGALIECHRIDGDYKAAITAADEALALAEAGDDCNAFMTGYNGHSAIAGLFFDLWEKRTRTPGASGLAGVPEVPQLKAYAKRALKQLAAARKLFPAVRTRELLHTGQFHRLDGSLPRARGSWTEAVELASKMRMPWEEASACLELGLIAEGDARKTWLARAEKVAAAAELTRLLERVRAARGN